MNFLAHSILSPQKPLVMLGNLAGDFVKGSKMIGLHQDVIVGVKMHRSIDTFTDSHLLVKEAKDMVRSEFRLFSGVVIDMFWDYFVANSMIENGYDLLSSHIDYVYSSANTNFNNLPEAFKPVFPYMEKYNWLRAYSTKEGLESIMLQMRYRIENKSPLDEAVRILEMREQEFQPLFNQFWKEALKEFKF